MEKIWLSYQVIQITLGNLGLQPFEKKNTRGYTWPRKRSEEVLQGQDEVYGTEQKCSTQKNKIYSES